MSVTINTAPAANAHPNRYKPLSGRDVRRSVAAVLLVNNSPEPRNLSFAFNEVPHLAAEAASAFALYDVWERTEVAGAQSQYGGYRAEAVPPHGSVFLKISNGA